MPQKVVKYYTTAEGIKRKANEKPRLDYESENLSTKGTTGSFVNELFDLLKAEGFSKEERDKLSGFRLFRVENFIYGINKELSKLDVNQEDPKVISRILTKLRRTKNFKLSPAASDNIFHTYEIVKYGNVFPYNTDENKKKLADLVVGLIPDYLEDEKLFSTIKKSLQLKRPIDEIVKYVVAEKTNRKNDSVMEDYPFIIDKLTQRSAQERNNQKERFYGALCNIGATKWATVISGVGIGVSLGFGTIIAGAAFGAITLIALYNVKDAMLKKKDVGFIDLLGNNYEDRFKDTIDSKNEDLTKAHAQADIFLKALLTDSKEYRPEDYKFLAKIIAKPERISPDKLLEIQGLRNIECIKLVAYQNLDNKQKSNIYKLDILSSLMPANNKDNVANIDKKLIKDLKLGYTDQKTIELFFNIYKNIETVNNSANEHNCDLPTSEEKFVELVSKSSSNGVVDKNLFLANLNKEISATVDTFTIKNGYFLANKIKLNYNNSNIRDTDNIKKIGVELERLSSGREDSDKNKRFIGEIVDSLENLETANSRKDAKIQIKDNIDGVLNNIEAARKAFLEKSQPSKNQVKI